MMRGQQDHRDLGRQERRHDTVRMLPQNGIAVEHGIDRELEPTLDDEDDEAGEDDDREGRSAGGMLATSRA